MRDRVRMRGSRHPRGQGQRGQVAFVQKLEIRHCIFKNSTSPSRISSHTGSSAPSRCGKNRLCTAPHTHTHGPVSGRDAEEETKRGLVPLTVCYCVRSLRCMSWSV